MAAAFVRTSVGLFDFPYEVWRVIFSKLELDDIINICVAVPNAYNSVTLGKFRLGLLKPSCAVNRFLRLSFNWDLVQEFDCSFCLPARWDNLQSVIRSCHNLKSLRVVHSTLTLASICAATSNLRYLEELYLSLNLSHLAVVDDCFWNQIVLSTNVGQSLTRLYVTLLHCRSFEDRDRIDVEVEAVLRCIARKPFLGFAINCRNLKTLNIDATNVIGSLCKDMFSHTPSNMSSAHAFFPGHTTLWLHLEQIIITAESGANMEAIWRRLLCQKCNLIPNNVTLDNFEAEPCSTFLHKPLYGLCFDVKRNCSKGLTSYDGATKILEHTGSSTLEIPLYGYILDVQKANLPCVTHLCIDSFVQAVPVRVIQKLVPEHIVELNIKFEVMISASSSIWTYLCTLKNLRALKILLCSIMCMSGGLMPEDRFERLEELFLDNYMCSCGSYSGKWCLDFGNFPALKNLVLDDVDYVGGWVEAFQTATSLRYLCVDSRRPRKLNAHAGIVQRCPQLRFLQLGRWQCADVRSNRKFWHQLQRCVDLRYFCMTSTEFTLIDTWHSDILETIGCLPELRKFHVHFRDKSVVFRNAWKDRKQAAALVLCQNLALKNPVLAFIDSENSSCITDGRGALDHLCWTQSRIGQIKPPYSDEFMKI